MPYKTVEHRNAAVIDGSSCCLQSHWKSSECMNDLMTFGSEEKGMTVYNVKVQSKLSCMN
jgi:hypothetical protein